MAVEQDPRAENEQYLGLTTLELAKVIVQKKPQIQRINLREYYYVPEKPSGEDEKIFILDRRDFLQGEKVDKLIANLQPGWNIAFNSTIEDQEGKVWQLPMMDLALRKSEINLVRTTQRLKKLIVPNFGGGFVLETNKSYHFFGSGLLDKANWFRFLGFSLLTSIVTVTPEDQENIHEMVADYRYIGHSLIRGSTGLRITANGTKTMLPRVIAAV